ncbi:FadR/GntR family transcriptional regulator [Phreatobacter stygius]|uniref:FadR family transcriptional regulator n=1 Tax=Phreatobacter stygius TaxID=1940610 RepID=A0A4D7AWB9_9HYPH|nr:FadR/GntR family transcriptional regulator [Phreatobacter stygius]QCI65369.1 FadR family transcriptional regulator [Phreatobacter stygius]
MSPFQAVDQDRLYERVARQVADLVARGDLKPGERLPAERELARMFGVSRPTVREAMIALEIAGLVEVRTGSGITVSDAPPSRVVAFDAGPSPHELIQARRMVEPEIAALAATSASADHVAALEALIADLEASPDHRASQTVDRAFHVAIARATGNTVLVAIVEGLWDRMFSPLFEVVSTRTGLPENRRMTLADHHIIVRALAARDPVAARAAMLAHLTHVQMIIVGPTEPAEEVA